MSGATVVFFGGPQDGEQLTIREPLPRTLELPANEERSYLRQMPRCPYDSPRDKRPPWYRWLRRRRWDRARELVEAWWREHAVAVAVGREVYYLERWAHPIAGLQDERGRQRFRTTPFYRHSGTPLEGLRACSRPCCTGGPDGL